MDPLSIILSLVVLIFSVILHEVAHGFMADWLGDPTARYSGRLTLNPIPHIDPIGSVAIPGILLLTGSPFMIGWAKPVPYNPYNLKNQRWGEALVAFAGPATNILLALVFALLVRFGISSALPVLLIQLFVAGVYTNIILAFYNLIPLPPLDGSKVLRPILPTGLRMGYIQLENMLYALGPVGLIGVSLVVIYALGPYLFGLVQSVFLLLTGLSV